MTYNLFSEEERNLIVRSVIEAEKITSAEIQVHIEKYCKDDIHERATTVFTILKMHKTKYRNGVLFYLAVEDKKFTVIGDAGIKSLVPENFWEPIISHVLSRIKSGKVPLGLSEGIKMAGGKLKSFFPIESNDNNELPDDISFGKDLEIK